MHHWTPRLPNPVLMLLCAGVLTTASATGQGLSVLSLLTDPAAVSARPAAPGYLGVNLVDVDGDHQAQLKLKDQHGALITLVDRDAPAGQAGLRVNDVVLTLNGQPVENAEQLRRQLREIPPGRRIALDVLRDGQRQSVALQLADRHAMEHDVWDHLGEGEPMPPMAMGLMGGNAPQTGGFRLPTLTGSLTVGALVEPLTGQMSEYLGVESGVMIKQVARKSSAETAGLKSFDVVLKVGQESIRTVADWDRALRSNQGKPVAVTILRDKKQQTMTLQVDLKHRSELDLPEEPQRNQTPAQMLAALTGDEDAESNPLVSSMARALDDVPLSRAEEALGLTPTAVAPPPTHVASMPMAAPLPLLPPPPPMAFGQPGPPPGQLPELPPSSAAFRAMQQQMEAQQRQFDQQRQQMPQMPALHPAF